MSGYIIRRGTYNGGIRREFCCRCGQQTVCTSPLGNEAALLCVECFEQIRKFCRCGKPIFHEEECK